MFDQVSVFESEFFFTCCKLISVFSVPSLECYEYNTCVFYIGLSAFAWIRQREVNAFYDFDTICCFRVYLKFSSTCFTFCSTIYSYISDCSDRLLIGIIFIDKIVYFKIWWFLLLWHSFSKKFWPFWVLLVFFHYCLISEFHNWQVLSVDEDASIKRINCFGLFLLTAALIFSAGYYSALIFFTSSNKKIFRFTSFCRFFNILREIFLTSLG